MCVCVCVCVYACVYHFISDNEVIEELFQELRSLPAWMDSSDTFRKENEARKMKYRNNRE